MIVLITNDDGIEADGLRVLREVVAGSLPGARVYTVAPADPMSQVAHRVTTKEPIPVRQTGEGEWAVGGTPADCVRVALFALLPQGVDWVFSGINHGGNLGQDIFISGTVAAAREAAFHGLRAVGFSQFLRRERQLDWDRAARWAGRALEGILAEDHRDGLYWNVNFPHLTPEEPEPGLVRTQPERRALPVRFGTENGCLRFGGIYEERPFSPGTDVAVCFGGQISISCLGIQA